MYQFPKKKIGSWALNQHIRMISEGSRDTEDWSNYTENSALITEISYFKLIFHNITILLDFDKICKQYYILH